MLSKNSYWGRKITVAKEKSTYLLPLPLAQNFLKEFPTFKIRDHFRGLNHGLVCATDAAPGLCVHTHVH